MKKYTIDFQLDPPQIYWINAVKRAIRTFNIHLILGLSTIDPYFFIIKWHRLLSQCLITLNLLHNYRVNSDLSAYDYIYGPYDCNKSPMASPGTHVMVHKKAGNKTPWDHHGTPG